MTVQKRIEEAIEAADNGPCEGLYERMAAAVQDVLEIWLPPLFASAIHAYADGEIQAYSYDGLVPALEAVEKLNTEAAAIASYALTSNKWRA